MVVSRGLDPEELQRMISDAIASGGGALAPGEEIARPGPTTLPTAAPTTGFAPRQDPMFKSSIQTISPTSPARMADMEEMEAARGAQQSYRQFHRKKERKQWGKRFGADADIDELMRTRYGGYFHNLARPVMGATWPGR